MKQKINLLLFLIMIALLPACDRGVLFDDNKIIDGSVWNQDDIVEFSIPIDDTISSFDFYLNVRHTTDYGYANIYFFITTEFPDGQAATDTVECIVADRSGKWLGTGIGKMKDNRILLKRGIRFPQAGDYHFRFEQAMRDPSLEGMSDIGIRIEKAKY